MVKQFWADSQAYILMAAVVSNLSILKTGKAKAIRFTTLGAVCNVLNCQPGDILECQENVKKTTSR